MRTNNISATIQSIPDQSVANSPETNPAVSQFHQVRPISPVAGYVGGKRILAKTIVPLIEATPHTLYAEPFIGMGGIFLRRSRAPKAEVINDISSDVVTFFRILQKHYAAFMEMLKFQLTSRKEFERLVATNPETLTDLERAARFLYLQKTGFGSKVVGRSFGVDPMRGARFDVMRLAPLLEALHERLSHIIMERLHYSVFIKRYDRPETLFYLDPPYWDCEDYYGLGVFGKEDFEKLAAQLAGIKGKFILSINDAPKVREIFKAFEITPVDVRYTLAGGARSERMFKELIIRN